MKLVVFNGSPRGKNSNSHVLIEQFIKGYRSVESVDVPVSNLVKRQAIAENLDLAGNAESIIVVFPLYTDCMPGIVLEFLEAFAGIKAKDGQKLGFIVHSGFPESVHSEYVERYLARFSKRLGFEYLGTIIKGGSEGVRLMPEQMTRKLFGRFKMLGEYFANNGDFSKELIDLIKKPYSLSAVGRLLYRLLFLTGLSNMYWNTNLKKNNAYEERFARPFKK